MEQCVQDAGEQLEQGQVDRLPGEDPDATSGPAPAALVATPNDDRAARPVAQFVGRFVSRAELAGLALSPFLDLALRPDSTGATAAVVSGGVDLLDDADVGLEVAVREAREEKDYASMRLFERKLAHLGVDTQRTRRS